MTLFLCNQYPALRIMDPESSQIVQFQGGKLELDKEDRFYALVAAEAARNPAIVVYESVTTCPECGEPFTGKAAKADLGRHRKDAHFDRWLADQDAKAAESRNAEIKGREGFACDQCAPVQTFPTTEALALHTRTLHA